MRAFKWFCVLLALAGACGAISLAMKLSAKLNAALAGGWWW